MTAPPAMPEVEPLSLSIKDTAKAPAISRSQVYVLLGDGKLTARTSGGRTKVEYVSVRAYHESLPAFVPGVTMPNARKSRKAVR
jgi:hypothetical protein